MTNGREKAYRRPKSETPRDNQPTLRPARQSPERAFSCALLFDEQALRDGAAAAVNEKSASSLN
jgi:hypothetical protein